MRKSEIFISVIIPCYNNQKHIKQAILSVINQTIKVHEIIVVDDGSTDDSLKEISIFKDQIKIIKQENRGRVEARKAGILEANGNWVALLDADDLWADDKIEKQVLAIKSIDENVVIIHSNFDLIYEKNESDRSYSYDIPLIADINILFHRNIFATSTVVMKKNILMKVLPYWNLGRYRAQDYGLYLLMLSHGKAFLVNYILGYYRIHDSNKHSQKDFTFGVAKARENLILYIKTLNKEYILPKDWKKILSKNYWDVGWNFYIDKQYKEARKYFVLSYTKNYFQFKALFYVLLLIFPDRFINLLRIFLKSKSI